MNPTSEQSLAVVASHTYTFESSCSNVYRYVLATFFSLFVIHYSFTQGLWYKQPARKWTEALPLGNGRIGAMIFGGVETDRIQFNEESLWTGEPREYNKKEAYQYLPQIRTLLNQGKQKEAEALAEKEFMGLKSSEGKKKNGWLLLKKEKAYKATPH